MAEHVYRDRKMMKWMPFNALMEQSDYLSDLLHGRTRIDKPVLSPDQEEELNYNLELAWVFKSEIIASYFEKGEIKEVEGILTDTDSFNKTITINDQELSALAITKIQFL
jgi:hypothetical protein